MGLCICVWFMEKEVTVRTETSQQMSVCTECMSGLILPGENILGNNRGHSSSILASWDFHFTSNIFYLVFMPLLPAATISLKERRSALVTITLVKKKPMWLQSSHSVRTDSRMTVSSKLRGEMDQSYHQCNWDKWRAIPVTGAGLEEVLRG